MAVTIYRSSDAGGPGNNLSGNLQNRLRQILRPCLVDGYVGKPAAGWSMVHEHADGFSIRPASAAGIANFIGYSTTAVHCYALEAVSSSAAALLTGENRRSGQWADTNSSITARHALRVDHTLNNLSTLSWTVIADNETFVLNVVLSSVAETNSFSSFSFYGGRYRNSGGLTGAAEFVLLGGDLVTTQPSSNHPFDTGYTLLRDPYSGAVNTGSGPLPSGRPLKNHINTRLSAFSGWLPEALNLAPINLIVGAGFAGTLRGIAYDPALVAYGGPTHCRALGLPENLTSHGAPVTINGVTLHPAWDWNCGYFLTAHPDFW